MPDKQIDAFQQNALHIGNNVIAQVKHLMPHGAGNMESNVIASQGKSIVGTDHVQRLTARETAATTGHVGYIAKPLLEARIAMQIGAGNCGSQAAIAYTLLRQELDSNFRVFYIQNKSPDHCYAAFQAWDDSANKANGPCVVVDPWPTNAQAVLLEDHFCNLNNVIIWRNKPGKRDDATAQHLLKPFKNPNLDQEVKNEVNNLNTSVMAIDMSRGGQYEQTFASAVADLRYLSNQPVANGFVSASAHSAGEDVVIQMPDNVPSDSSESSGGGGWCSIQ